MRYYLLAITTLTILGCSPSSGVSTPSASPTSETQQIETVEQVAQSHIEGNAPSAQDFQGFLRRDLTSYLAPTYGPDLKVDIEMLRDGPTQSGVSFPKYYIWAKARSSSGNPLEGAARVAGIDTTHFEVTDFLTAEQIVNAPTILRTVFPEMLWDGILERAKRAQGV